MNIFKLLNNLYTNTSSKWIADVEDSDIKPYLIQRWLSMNDAVRVQTRWLDKYIFALPPKMYLSLAWSVIPKAKKAPFVKYIKRGDEKEDAYHFLFDMIRKQYEMADNDFIAVKERLEQAIIKEREVWFSYYGIKRGYWGKFHMDFKLIKTGGTFQVPQKALELWDKKDEN